MVIKQAFGVENQRVLPRYITILFFAWAFVFSGILYMFYKAETQAQSLEYKNDAVVAELKTTH